MDRTDQLSAPRNAEDFTAGPNSPLRVAKVSAKGRGVFAKTTIHAGQVIEEAPSWGFSATDEILINQTGAFEYYFVRNDRDISNEELKGYLVFGLISIVNHSATPNARIRWTDRDSGAWASIIAIRDIAVGEEITHKYTNIDAYRESGLFTS
jgi:hypothetical protein